MHQQQRLIHHLIRSLQDSGHKVQVRETHISWVLLFGNRAWKIKKQLDFGFLDFSTLDKRQHACEEEIRLNRRFAPELYLRVMAIGGTVEQPVFEGQLTPIEYAVVMQRFDESLLLSAMATQHQLSKEIIDAIAVSVATIHHQAPIAAYNASWGEAGQIHHWLLESIQHLRAQTLSPEEQQQVSFIDGQCQRLYEQKKTPLQARSDSGFVRECHGDLHLGNMIWQHSSLMPFDCIEFNPALRWIDVISEAAFVMMDLQHQQYPGYSWRFINHYLAETGDYTGLEVLQYYFVYRALVRAKVTRLQAAADDTSLEVRLQLNQQYANYMALSERWLTPTRAVLMITHGLSGSGKSTLASILSEEHGCIHLRSDIERKRLHGLTASTDSQSSMHQGIYTDAATDYTYQRLYEIAQHTLGQGYPVIVDAAFLEYSRREYFEQLARDLDCPYLILHCEADEAILTSRIRQRQQCGEDPSEATREILSDQIRHQRPLLNTEHFVTFSPECTPDLPPVVMHRLHIPA